ncbi:naringenin 8-dimethylallyltransferase 2, chloroplastic isoform X1 [Arachis ipaensis]|uniref:naringenin 8-dimethylallyltransferase 2, chloroplastic isoform X1 n=1 Tax=Arachis ipaensis TaxID=130454 RepID=UPI0007AF9779|nr:naringenin 8-dimethylallyltransferase 2, chloroplastic isoform X1 [Arachis ipaensis]XP_025626894.1 naringenin 8-dimethylallyltransferase 2, chloroplastic isoform X1 [Arachis hypogaea]
MASTSKLLLGSSLFPHPTPSSLSITTGSIARRALWHKKRKLQSLEHNWNHSYKFIHGGSTPHKPKTRNFLMKATSEPFDTQTIWKSTKDILHTVQKFTISYYLITVIMCISSTSVLAVENLSDISPKFFIGLFKFIIPIIFMHWYTVGINQLVDVEIDKINKPYRPLVSGKISYKTGVIISISCLFMGFGLGWITKSKPLLWCLVMYFVAMTGYSINLPLLRWKKFTIPTLLSTVPPMLIANNIAPFLHMKIYVLEKTTIFPRSIVFTIVVMSFYYLVIMLFKDIPDIEGDTAAGLQNLSIRLGPKRVFWLCVLLLEMGYGIAIIMGATSSFLWSKIVTVIAHGIMALIFWYRANSVDLKSKDASQSFYMFIFKLLCVENILILLVR